MDGAYVHVATEPVPFCRIITENRPQGISNADELALLKDAFQKTAGGCVLVEFDSPLSLRPACLAKIQFLNQIKDVWVAAGAPKITFLSPPPLLWVILKTLQVDYVKY
tara:strand:- start:463 stop:786 length:324 start_codon:yes stop_codon:yes gene_type:complete